jgi:anti-sigma B factor antagonist
VNNDAPGFRLHVTANSEGPVLLLKGDLDLAAAPELRARLVEFAGKNVTLDFSDVTFLDSTAIGVLVAAHDRSVRAGKRITIHGVQPGQLRMFELMGLLDRMTVEGDEAGTDSTA